MVEAEERLIRGSRFEEALKESEKPYEEEQRKHERLQFIKEEERKLMEALMQKE